MGWRFIRGRGRRGRRRRFSLGGGGGWGGWGETRSGDERLRGREGWIDVFACIGRHDPPSASKEDIYLRK